MLRFVRRACAVELVLALPSLMSLSALGGCGGAHSAPGGGVTSDAGAGPQAFDAGHLDEPYRPAAACPVTIDTPPVLPATHVAIGSAITWSSNPPSSGPHYPVWAAYRAYTSPVDRGYTVHDLEHGAIVFSYRCDAADSATCASVAAAIAQAAAAIPDDPLCLASTGDAVRARIVITPDPLLDVPVAAAAWGWTYKADCVDVPTLIDFARAHYGHSPEDLCADGQSQL